MIYALEIVAFLSISYIVLMVAIYALVRVLERNASETAELWLFPAIIFLVYAASAIVLTLYLGHRLYPLGFVL